MYGNLFTVYTLYGGGFKAHNAPCYLMGVKAVISDNFKAMCHPFCYKCLSNRLTIIDFCKHLNVCAIFV